MLTIPNINKNIKNDEEVNFYHHYTDLLYTIKICKSKKLHLENNRTKNNKIIYDYIHQCNLKTKDNLVNYFYLSNNKNYLYYI